MKITKVRVRQVTGTMHSDETFWEERLVRPIDIYPDDRKQPPLEVGGEPLDDRTIRLTQWFV